MDERSSAAAEAVSGYASATSFNKLSELLLSGSMKPASRSRSSALSLAKRAGMKITYGSDAHAPEAVGRDFAAAEQLAKECGFSGFVTFEKRRPIDLPFS